jgi:hypothetical protein
MKETITTLRQIVESFVPKLSAIDGETFSAKPQPQKWSKNEVLGHLVDSAQNNLRRFICAQYEARPPQILYKQDFWVSANGYVNYWQADIIGLWRLVNLQICHVLENMPEENYQQLCSTSPDPDYTQTLEWLAADHVKHLKHHLNQIIPQSYDVTYP